MEAKRMAAAALAGMMLLCTACGQEEETGEAAPTGTAVEVAEVTAGPMSASYSLTGKVAAVNEVQVFPLLAGQVLTLSVEEGDTVSRGQTLLTVDTSTVTSTMGALQESYRATQSATESAVASAELGVEQAQIGVDQAQQALENVDMVLREATTREYYNGETGVGQGMCPFWGWSALGYVMAAEAKTGYDPADPLRRTFETLEMPGLEIL